MSALSTEAIKERLHSGDWGKRLVVSPLLDPDAQLKSGQASVDVRLGFEFCLVSPSSTGSIDELNTSNGISNFSSLYRRQYIPFGAGLTIHPHQFMLAQTLEYLRFPGDLMAYVVGRSTWGRLGLIVATAVGIHPGFAGSLTLELRNLGETPLTLYPGQTIAQLFIHEVVDSKGDPAQAIADRAQYAGTVDMVPQRISSGHTHTTLVKLRDRFEQRSNM